MSSSLRGTRLIFPVTYLSSNAWDYSDIHQHSAAILQKQTHLLAVNALWSKLKGCCFNCLKSGHALKDCKVDRACAHCGRKGSHHRSLCNTLFEQSASSQIISSESSSAESKPEGAMVASTNQVLIQTATVTVRNRKQSSSTLVRLILDSGSQRSFITEKLANVLQLTLDRTETISCYLLLPSLQQSVL